MLWLFMKGLVIGFSIAAPVGPIAMLCIQRSVRFGFISGMMIGLGAATADGICGSLAALGLTLVTTILETWQLPITIAGGIVLLYMGSRLILLTKPDTDNGEDDTKQDSLLSSYLSAVALTLTNPVTLLSFIAVFAGIGLGSTGDNPLQAGFFILGITLGSTLWWLILSSATSLVIRHRLSVKGIHRIDLISGAILLAFGSVAIASALPQIMR